MHVGRKRVLPGLMAAGPLVLLCFGTALAEDNPKLAQEPVQYFRYDDPAAPSRVYKVLAVVFASASLEVQAVDCVTGTPYKLLRTKLRPTGDRSCDPANDHTGPGPWVITATVEKIEGEMVTVSYELAGGGKQTLILPKDVVTKTDVIRPGARVLVFPKDLSVKKETDFLKDFKALQKNILMDPKALGNEKTFGFQLK